MIVCCGRYLLAVNWLQLYEYRVIDIALLCAQYGGLQTKGGISAVSYLTNHCALVCGVEGGILFGGEVVADSVALLRLLGCQRNLWVLELWQWRWLSEVLH